MAVVQGLGSSDLAARQMRSERRSEIDMLLARRRRGEVVAAGNCVVEGEGGRESGGGGGELGITDGGVRGVGVWGGAAVSQQEEQQQGEEEGRRVGRGGEEVAAAAQQRWEEDEEMLMAFLTREIMSSPHTSKLQQQLQQRKSQVQPQQPRSHAPGDNGAEAAVGAVQDSLGAGAAGAERERERDVVGLLTKEVMQRLGGFGVNGGKQGTGVAPSVTAVGADKSMLAHPISPSASGRSRSLLLSYPI